MPFQDFFGNIPIVQTVRRQLTDGRLPQSLLFVGIEGVGKATLASFIAKALNCPHRSSNADFCDACATCRRVSDGEHADVKIVRPENQFIVIDQIRELNRALLFKPFESSRRVFIVDQAEKMNLPAANSFLKSLEEPPETSILILVSSRPDELLTTIRSRCQTYHFGPLSRGEIEQLLDERSLVSAQDKSLLARISEGSLGRALTMDLDQHKLQRKEMFQLIKSCSQDTGYSKAIKAAAPWLERRNKDAFDDRTRILFSLLRDLHYLKVSPSASGLVNQDIQDQLSRVATFYSRDRLVRAAKSLDHAQAGARRNLNRGLAVDSFLFALLGEPFVQTTSPKR